jgi:membrane associated rhomboid family serine protease
VRAPPPSDAYRLLFTPPPVVSWLLASFVAVLGLMLILPPPVLDRFLGSFAFIPLALTNAPWAVGLSAGDYFQTLFPLVSYSFLHGGLLHLLMNGLGFLIVGTIAARRMGDTSFLLFCVITGIFAGLTHWAFYVNSGTPLVGASGMLSGLVGATSRFVMLDLRGVWGRAGGLMPLTDRRFVIFTLIWLALNYALGSGGVGAGPGQSIAWEAHMGGYFAGALLFPLFDWREPYRTLDMVVYEEIP